MSLHDQHILFLILRILAVLCWLACTVSLVWPRPRPSEPNGRIPFNLIALGLVLWAIPILCYSAQHL